jgi:hypothetical protein
MNGRDADRFWSKVRVAGEDECWLWQAAPDDKGYGAFKYKGHMHKAHRLALGFFERVRRDRDVLHSCDTPACCNPAHLFQGTHSDNMKDCAAKGRLNSQQRKLRLKNGGGDGIRTHDTPCRGITV